jgi:hypothetical protein
MRKIKNLALVVMIVALFTSCGTTGKFIKVSNSFPAAENGKGVVYFYRPSAFTGAAVSYNIFHDNQIIGASKNGKYFYYQSNPGLQVFSATTEVKRELAVDIETGKSYYVKSSVVLGFLVGRPKFSIENESIALEEIKKCQMIEMIDSGENRGKSKEEWAF